MSYNVAMWCHVMDGVGTLIGGETSRMVLDARRRGLSGPVKASQTKGVVFGLLRFTVAGAMYCCNSPK